MKKLKDSLIILGKTSSEMMVVGIRKFRKQDAQKVADLIKTTLYAINARHYPKRIIENLVAAYSKNPLIERMKTREGFVALKANKIIGVIQLTNDGWLTGLFVDQTCQKHGIGKKTTGKSETTGKKTRF